MNRNKHKHSSDPGAGAAASAPDVAEAAATPPANPPGEPAAETLTEEPGQKLQQALAASQDQYVRLLADFDNYRKRMARERTEIVKRANQDIVTDILPIIDHFELALNQTPDPDDPFAVGVKMVYDQLVAALNKSGLDVIDAPGQAFDPVIHEAIASQPSRDVDEGYVILQTRRGYRLGDYVIRPASVIVSSGAPQSAPAPGSDATSVNDAAPEAASDTETPEATR